MMGGERKFKRSWISGNRFKLRKKYKKRGEDNLREDNDEQLRLMLLIANNFLDVRKRREKELRGRR